MAKIIIKINTLSGAVKVSGDGYQGETCKERTKIYTDRLGVIESDTPTEEMYVTEENRENQNQS